MKKFGVSRLQSQKRVNAYFQSQSWYWKDIYNANDVQAEIYRKRQATVLAWIDDLSLAPESQVLEIGCGAGLLSVALAQRGLRVHAVDSTEAMVELARQHAEEAGMTGLLSVEAGDACSLTFADNSFDLVVALGVIPWLAQPELAVQEMARVTKRDGHVILSADNRARLIYLLDPRMNPAIEPLRSGVKAVLERFGLLHPSAKSMEGTLHDCRFIDETLMSNGLVKTRGVTLGFGPFTFLYRKVFPKPFGIRLHRWFQALADRNVPIFRSRGAQYLVQASKSD